MRHASPGRNSDSAAAAKCGDWCGTREQGIFESIAGKGSRRTGRNRSVQMARFSPPHAAGGSSSRALRKKAITSSTAPRVGLAGRIYQVAREDGVRRLSPRLHAGGIRASRFQTLRTAFGAAFAGTELPDSAASSPRSRAGQPAGAPSMPSARRIDAADQLFDDRARRQRHHAAWARRTRSCRRTRSADAATR